jgi:hypothetical protein
MRRSVLKIPIRSLQGGSVPSWRPYAWVGEAKLRAAREVCRLGKIGKEGMKMIRLSRSAKVVNGKFPQAMQWAKEITEFANKKYKIQIGVYLDIFGEVGTIRWVTDYADLAAYEKVRNQLLADQAYWKKLNQSAELFVQGSVFDTVMQAI